MNKPSVLLMFPLGDLSIAVDAHQAHLVLDSYSSARIYLREDGVDASQVVHNGKLIPCLDLRWFLGLDEGREGDDPLTIILEHNEELVCVRIPRLESEYSTLALKTSAVPERFQGIARLLLEEQLHTSRGLSLKLDVEMAVRIGRQRRSFVHAEKSKEAIHSATHQLG